MYFASAEEMAKLDDLAVNSGLEIRQMMELAGWHILQLFAEAKIEQGAKVAIVVGKGNKGGDGLSAARHLVNYGYEVDVYLLESEISPDAQHHLDLLRSMEVPIHEFNGQSFTQYDVIIDSLIGYRLHGAPRDDYAKAIELINDSSAKVVSYDIPTGVNATTGEAEGEAVNADYTLMLALTKKSVQNSENRDKFGQIHLADIGITTHLYDQISPNSRPAFNKSGLLKLPSDSA